jgi:hypothetical protein
VTLEQVEEAKLLGITLDDEVVKDGKVIKTKINCTSCSGAGLVPY